MKFLFFKSCFNQLFISNANSCNFFLDTNWLKSLESRVTINQALIPWPVASHIKKLYFSFSSEKPNVSPDILSAHRIFQ